MRRWTVLLFLLGWLMLPLAAPPTQAQGEGVVMVLEVKGIINPLTAQYLNRALGVAEQRQARLVVLILDTPGGLEIAMRAMVLDLLQAPVPTVVFVAPDGARATSAGMFITLAGHVAAMAPATHIGAAHPVPLGGEADEVTSEKMTSDAAALIRAVAEKRARNSAWPPLAVRENVSLTASEALAEGVIDLIATDLPDLLRQLDGRRVATNGDTITLLTGDAPIERLPMSLIERLMHVVSDPNIAYLLLALGTLLLYTELANPGLSVAGVGSAVCYILAFMALGNLPVNWAGVALLAVSMVFFVVGLLTDTEVIVTIAGLVPFVLGSLVLFSPLTPTSPAMPSLRVSLWLIGIVAATIVLFTLGVLRAVLRASRLPPQSGADGLIGHRGLALTDLTPDGQVRVDLQGWSAVATASDIAAGQTVRVVGVSGVRLQVVAEVMDEQEGGP
jgi:membrane-bound serine protease (ClpP class)